MRSHLAKNDKNWQGPWGTPPGGGSGGGGSSGGGGGNKNQQPPDLDELLKRSQERFRGMLPQDGGQKNRFLTLIASAALLLWASLGIYMVEADELGVVMRFGRFDRTTLPGIHYHLPYPIEQVKTPKVTTVNKIEVGFTSGFGGRGQEKAVSEEALMLTGDENIVDIHFEVQWKIDKVEDFLFNVRDPEPTIKAVAESAMREIIGKMEIMSVISEGAGREEAEEHTRTAMQSMLDSYHAGVEIAAVNMLKADPPAEVIEAFRDVQSARADQETERNKAEAYRNDILPRARGQAEQMIQEAEAYKQEVVARASGEASRFAAVFEEYKAAPAVVRNRMYLEAMEYIFQGMNKVIVDEKAGSGVLPFLPLQDFAPKKPATTGGTP